MILSSRGQRDDKINAKNVCKSHVVGEAFGWAAVGVALRLHLLLHSLRIYHKIQTQAKGLLARSLLRKKKFHQQHLLLCIVRAFFLAKSCTCTARLACLCLNHRQHQPLTLFQRATRHPRRPCLGAQNKPTTHTTATESIDQATTKKK